MSKANAARTLPPGDRDELPFEGSRGPDSSAAPVAGREVAPKILPAIVLEIDRLGPAVDELQMLIGDFKLAHTQERLALMQSATFRIASIANHVHRTVKHCRARETELQQPTKE